MFPDDKYDPLHGESDGVPNENRSDAPAPTDGPVSNEPLSSSSPADSPIQPSGGEDTPSGSGYVPVGSYGSGGGYGSSPYGPNTDPAANPYGAGTGYGYNAGYGSGRSVYGGTSGQSTYSGTSSGGGSGYVPPTPPTTPPSSDQNSGSKRKKRVKKERRGLRSGVVVALCLVCALAGGCASGGVFALVSSRNQAEQTVVSEEEPQTTSTVQASGRTTTVETTVVEPGETMSVAEIYAAYSGSVVCIEISTSAGTGAGTGFVITDDGYIVTCYHVIDGAEEISVTFPSTNESFEAELIGGDEDEDIAVLKIDAAGLTPVVLGDSSLLQVGDTVTAIGNALGTLSNTTTTGVVSALDRAISMSDGSVMILLQTDCTVNSGNSGGPLFNAYGEVIGIVNAKYSSSGYSSEATIEGIGFAIPYSSVADKITDLMEYGYITGKPYLGITVSTVSPLDAQQYNMVVGAFVNSVEEGSCAEAGGLKASDIITGVDGIEITSYEELVAAKNSHSAGEEMVLEVWRSGETLTITVILDEEPPETETEPEESEEPESDESDDGSDSGESGGGQNYSDIDPWDFFDYFFGGGNSGDYGYGGRGGW